MVAYAAEIGTSARFFQDRENYKSESGETSGSSVGSGSPSPNKKDQSPKSASPPWKMAGLPPGTNPALQVRAFATLE